MRAITLGIIALAILNTAYAEENLNMAANNQTMQSQSIAEKNKATGAAFLEKNKNKSGVKSLADGLQYKVLKAGTGPQPTEMDTVTVNYEGKLIDGTVFDSSYERGQPMTFQLSNVIPGWVEALKLMKTGSVWEIYIPSSLAYGEQGAPPSIGPNETLIFKVELLNVKKA